MCPTNVSKEIYVQTNMFKQICVKQTHKRVSKQFKCFKQSCVQKNVTPTRVQFNGGSESVYTVCPGYRCTSKKCKHRPEDMCKCQALVCREKIFKGGIYCLKCEDIYFFQYNLSLSLSLSHTHTHSRALSLSHSLTFSSPPRYQKPCLKLIYPLPQPLPPSPQPPPPCPLPPSLCTASG
jgi:hypothetical protein